MNMKSILGVEMEAVKFNTPVPHWRVKVLETGIIIEAGVFKGESRPKMWESAEHIANLIGATRWKRDMGIE